MNNVSTSPHVRETEPYMRNGEEQFLLLPEIPQARVILDSLGYLQVIVRGHLPAQLGIIQLRDHSNGFSSDCFPAKVVGLEHLSGQQLAEYDMRHYNNFQRNEKSERAHGQLAVIIHGIRGNEVIDYNDPATLFTLSKQ